MLDECLEFLEEREKKTQGFTYELIIVSDGSNDKTVEVASDYSSKYGSEKIKVLELIKNRGKGGAVRLVSTSVFSTMTSVVGETKGMNGSVKGNVEMCCDE